MVLPVGRWALHKMQLVLETQALPAQFRAVVMLGAGMVPERLQLMQAHCSLKAAEGWSLCLPCPSSKQSAPVTTRAAGLCTGSDAKPGQQQARMRMSCTHMPAADSQSLGRLPAKEL